MAAEPETSDILSAREIGERAGAILAQLRRVIVGKQRFIEKLLCTVLAGGHVLIEDLPGLAKTLTAQSLARAVGFSFKRIQFTPDLLPADITGTHVFNAGSRSFELLRGPIFANLILADEINRASPKTQSGLLEAMEEGQVTLDGESLAVPQPFIVIATQNPIEHEGTFPLPEAQLDRFMTKLSIGYPSIDEEVEILARPGGRAEHVGAIEQVCDGEEFLAMRAGLGRITFDADLLRYAVTLVDATRRSEFLAVGASPRASVALMLLARARAAIEGREFVIPDDVKFLAFEVLTHRVILKPELWTRGMSASDVATSIIGTTPVPK